MNMQQTLIYISGKKSFILYEQMYIVPLDKCHWLSEYFTENSDNKYISRNHDHLLVQCDKHARIEINIVHELWFLPSIEWNVYHK